MKDYIGRLHQYGAKARFRLRNAILDGPARTKNVYYRFVGREFVREQLAVGAGIVKYQSTSGTKVDLYHLRRNVHMIEKGLVMQPRRSTFALDYITETVSLLAVVSEDEPARHNAEMAWFIDVLDEYFKATSQARHPIIIRAEESFRSLLSTSDMQVGGESRPDFVGDLSDDQFEGRYETVLNLARNRRSVRWYKPEPVPRAHVDAAVAVSQEAPTACNRQPFRFVIADDPSVIRELASIPMGTAGFAHQIPGLVVVVGDLSAFFDERDRHLIYIDSSLAAMSFIFALESRGISSCIINWPDIPERESKIKLALGLQNHERVVMFIAYGYADPGAMAPYSAKKDLNAAVEYLDNV